MKRLWIVILIIFLALLLWGVMIAWQQLSGAWPAFGPGASDAPSLSVPNDFSLSVFARGLPNARVMAFDTSGNLWVSQPSQGIVSTLEVKDGKVVKQYAAFRNLRNPHGLAFDPDNPNALYIAEEHRIVKALLYTDTPLEHIADLPAGTGHSTRTIAFGPDKRLYVSIGSSCNVCRERDERRASVYSMNKDGSDVKKFASGLRNAVFFTWHPTTKEMWATEMGRDLLGDDTPPDEINIIKEEGNYGWPACYGKNIHDTTFDKNTYARNPCMEPFETPSLIDIPAHSAPLGLAFIPLQGWPQEYVGDLLVAYHGSWNRSTPTGYKIVRFELDEQGNMFAQEEAQNDMITGWLVNSREATGRPVDILALSGGIAYISDDKAGLIYQLRYTP